MRKGGEFDMKRHFKVNRKIHKYGLTIGIAFIVLIFCSAALGIDKPGLVVNIYPDEANPELSVSLGQPIKLIMVIKNDTNFAVNTERGFSKLEPHRYLKLIDPDGTLHVVKADVMSGDAPPPFFIGEKSTIPAEKIPADWVKSEIIADLTEIFPVMKQTVGWYTLQAHMPYMQIVFTLVDDQLGLLGIIDSKDADAATQNFEGTLDSNKMQIEVKLPDNQRGAHIKVQVFDQSAIPPRPLNSVPVRVYDDAAIAGLTPAQVWANGPGFAVLTGTSNDGGTVIWDRDLCLVEKNYTAMAYFNEYKSVPISAGEDGWATQCNGILQKTINFGEAKEKLIFVSGRAYNIPEGSVFRAHFSMDANNENLNPSGWFKYYYTKTRFDFKSSNISELTASGNSATIKGTGTANGTDGFSFEAIVSDQNPDMFGITIRDSNGTIYHSASAKETISGNLKVIIQTAAEEIVGDMDGDGDSDGKDIVTFAAAYAKKDLKADLNADGIIDNKDILYFTRKFGTFKN
jgi:hypothetical protein